MNAPYYASGSGLGLQNLGQANPMTVPPPSYQPVVGPTAGPATILFYVVDMLSIALSAFHGYRRHNGSVGAAIGWGVLGGLFPVIVPAVGFAQGFAQPMRVKSNKKRPKKSRRRTRR